MNNNKNSIAIVASIILALIIVGCTSERAYQLKEYNGPGFIEVQKDNLSGNEAIDISALLTDEGFEPIVDGYFYDRNPNFWSKEYIYNEDGTQIVFGDEDREVRCVSEDFARLLWYGINVDVEGRSFTNEDIENYSQVCLIPEYTALNIYESSDKAIGRVLQINNTDFEIIGVYKGSVDFNTAKMVEILIPYTTATEITDEINFLSLYIWIDDGRELSSVASEVFDLLNGEGYKANVVYYDDNFETIDVLSPP